MKKKSYYITDQNRVILMISSSSLFYQNPVNSSYSNQLSLSSDFFLFHLKKSTIPVRPNLSSREQIILNGAMYISKLVNQTGALFISTIKSIADYLEVDEEV